MAGLPNGSGPLHGGAVPYQSHQGLMLGAVGPCDEIRLQIDPVDGYLDHEVGGLLCGKVRLLRNVAQEIDKEAKLHSFIANQLHLTLIKARAGVKNNVRTLNRRIDPYGSSIVIHVIVYALICFFLPYLRFSEDHS